jgi:hypothetical protein
MRSAPAWIRLRRTAVLGLAIAALALAVGVQVAGATVVEKGRYAEQYAFVDDSCGFPLEFVGEVKGTYRIRQGTGKTASAFFLHDRFTYRDVVTNLETGEWFVLRGSGVFNEVKAKRVSGTVFEFTAVEAGQPFVIEDSTGRVVVRDRGVLRHRILFDTLGDDESGGEFVLDLGTTVHGPHPGFADDFPFCEIAAELTGA